MSIKKMEEANSLANLQRFVQDDLNPDASIQLELPVRQAQCDNCKRIVEVNEKTRRAFIITPRPDWEMDSMYDGCRGWD